MSTVCHQLGHNGIYFLVNISTPTDAKNATFSGSVNCNGQGKYLSQCSITASASESCSELSYIQCKCCKVKRIKCRAKETSKEYKLHWGNLIVDQNLECSTFCFHILGGHWVYYNTTYYKPLLQDKQRSPDSSFSASASSEGRSASDARISSGSSWCAPVSDDKHYLQVDLGRLYCLYRLVTYGDSTSRKWVATYNLNYTIDFAMVNWNTLNKVRKNDITNNNFIACSYLAIVVSFLC
jgi:hypothetical protein